MKPILLHTCLLFVSLGLWSCGKDQPQKPSPAPLAAPAGARLDTYEELAADMAATRHIKDGAGRAWLASGPASVRVRSRAAWTFGFEAGPGGIDEGGTVFFMVSPFWDWSLPQNLSLDRVGYTSVETWDALGDDDALVLEPSSLGSQLFAIKITGRALETGEKLRVSYGSQAAGSFADKYAEREAPFWFAVDGDGDGVRSIVVNSPTITITAGPPAQLLLHLPGTARPGETVRVTAALLDATGSSPVEFSGNLMIAGDARWPGLPERLEFTESGGGVVHFDFTLSGEAPEGVLRIGAAAVSDEDQGPRPLTALSNPMLISDSANRVLWADLHGHSNLSDGTGTPEDYYAYARDVAALDIVALTDHDHFGVRFLDAPANADLWLRIKRTAKAHNDPGLFTSLLAFEWTSWLYGHRHVVYFGDEGEIISTMDESTDDPAELWEALRGKPALTFAHHSAGAPIPTDWSFAPDPELEPVTEITSVHGVSEAMDAPLRIRGAQKGNFVRDVLDAGERLGFIGSGDSHDGHPGLAHLTSGTGGLAGILSEQNTRAGVRDALQRRACYATNGPRMLLFAELAGFQMGREMAVEQISDSSVLEVKLFGTTPITRLEVIRSGVIVASFDADAMEQSVDLPPDFAAAMTLESAGLKDLKSGEYVYLRAVQEGPGVAWSSAWFIR